LPCRGRQRSIADSNDRENSANLPRHERNNHQSPFGELLAQRWWGLFASARAPKEILSQLTRWFSDALRAPEVESKLKAEGFSPAALCGADFSALLRRQFNEYGRIIREANVRAE